jgi:glycosyltransferase involved in cell wall biosynthesis
MPEIGGSEAILINPENPDEIAAQMLRLEHDKAYYETQKEIGLKRASMFSWRKTAEQLLKLYETVYKELPNSNIS